MRVFILIWGVFVCGGDRNPRVILQPSAVRGVGVLSVILVQRLGSHRRAHLESETTGNASHQQLAALRDLVWRKLRSESGGKLTSSRKNTQVFFFQTYANYNAKSAEAEQVCATSSNAVYFLSLFFLQYNYMVLS